MHEKLSALVDFTFFIFSNFFVLHLPSTVILSNKLLFIIFQNFLIHHETQIIYILVNICYLINIKNIGECDL